MAEESPYKIFLYWLFDGNIKSEIPKKEILLKYNSPINHTYLISLFLKVAKLNQYINNYLNNINLRYIDREELFYFIKKCVTDYKVKRNQICYIVYKRKDKLFLKLKTKNPLLKDYDISLLCNIVDKSKERNSIYTVLNIDDGYTKSKQKNKNIKNEKINSDEFIKNNFVLEKL